MNFCGFDLELTHAWASIAEGELQLWKKYYLPADPKGLVVLDVGAGQGETAAFYLSHGAKKVVAIQPDWDPTYGSPLPVLRRNAEKMGNVEVVADYFKLEHLAIPHDILKMDCEGGEALLYGYPGPLKPCMIEAHGNDVAAALCAKFPLKRVYPLSKDKWLIWLLQPLASPLPEFVQRPGLAKPEDDRDYLAGFEP